MKEEKLHFFLGLADMAIYLTNRFLVKPAVITNNGIIAIILKNHLNDFLGSFLFCSYYNILVVFTKPDLKITSFWHYLIIGMICAAFWEGVVPAFLTRSTADILDCIAYLFGACCYYFCFKAFSRRGYHE